MMLLMIFSRSDYVWPLVLLYHVWLFLSHRLYGRGAGGHVSGNHERRHPWLFLRSRDICCVFRPYDQVRYTGIYNNCNLNGLFYLEVLAASIRENPVCNEGK